MAAHHEDRDGLAPEVESALKKLEIKLKNEERKKEVRNFLVLSVALFTSAVIVFASMEAFAYPEGAAPLLAVPAWTFGIAVIAWLIFGFWRVKQASTDEGEGKDDGGGGKSEFAFPLVTAAMVVIGVFWLLLVVWVL